MGRPPKNATRAILLTAALAGFVFLMNRAASSRPSGPAANSRFAEKETGDSVRRRDEYFLRKRGLIFGVPPAAYAKAMEHMRAMRRRRFNSASPGAEESAAIWNFIGPQPIIQFSPFNPTGTGRLTAVAVDPNVNNRVIVGDETALDRDEFVVDRCNWIPFDAPPGPVEATVKIRYNHPGTAATVESLGDGRAKVKLHAAQRAITPGQAAVFYQDDLVVGGGWIMR